MTTRGFVSRSLWAIALFSTELIARSGAAQSVAPGTRLRVIYAIDGERPITGKLVRRAADTVWMSRNDDESAIPVLLNENARVEQSEGRSHKLVRGLVGGVIGLIGGSIFASAFTPKGCTGECDSYGTGEVASALSVPFIFIPLGVFVGVKSARERWKPVAAASLSGGAAVGAKGVRFSATLVF
ncbi:MAG: hypothetical protein ABI120_16065 [Gemmatimonadaceae bacterium]